jgi:hypothetical protein
VCVYVLLAVELVMFCVCVCVYVLLTEEVVMWWRWSLWVAVWCRVVVVVGGDEVV